jgi:hypothetical protein
MVRRLDMHKTQGIEHLFSTGMSKRKIARTLGIDCRSVDRHLADIQSKGAIFQEAPTGSDVSKGAKAFTRSDASIQSVPLRGIAVLPVYAVRRVDCEECGVITEHVPWACGKNHHKYALRLFLATWGKRISRKETVAVFSTSWNGASFVDYFLSSDLDLDSLLADYLRQTNKTIRSVEDEVLALGYCCVVAVNAGHRIGIVKLFCTRQMRIALP